VATVNIVRTLFRCGAAAAALLGAANAGATVSVRDDTGAVVALAAPATRIVSLAPHATELLFAVGAGPRVVGVITTSDWPPEAKGIQNIGDARSLDLERIVALRPDLVVTWPYTAPSQIESLRAQGVAVFTTDPKTIDGIADDLVRLGTLAGSEVQAATLAAAFRTRLSQLRARRVAGRRIGVFYEIWNAPLYTIGGRHLITEAIGVCGGVNVFAASTVPAPVVSVEAVLAARPEAIIAGADGGIRPAWLDDWRRWSDLPAVARGHLFVVDANLLHRAGPRFLDGVEALCVAIDAARGR
jgi:iron complex transport system substrate-binding protein